MASAAPPSLQLVVPGLVPEDSQNWRAMLNALPSLRRLLSRSSRTAVAADHFTANLLTAFGVRKQADWPAAPFTLLADGGDPSESYWLRADPVHLLAQRSELVLVETARLQLSTADCASLIASLNDHFASEALLFTALETSRWYLHTPQPLRVSSTPPALAASRSVDPLLAHGDDALELHRWSNEIQMLLHDHPVNQQREARGEPPINSLWFWGGGRLVRPQIPAETSVWANDPLLRGLALAARLPLRPAPVDAESWLARAEGGEHVILVEALASSAASGENAGWAEQAQALEQAWFAPLLAALGSRRVSHVRVLTQHARAALRYDLAPADLWKVWRRSVEPPAALPLDPAHA